MKHIFSNKILSRLKLCLCQPLVRSRPTRTTKNMRKILHSQFIQQKEYNKQWRKCNRSPNCLEFICKAVLDIQDHCRPLADTKAYFYKLMALIIVKKMKASIRFHGSIIGFRYIDRARLTGVNLTTSLYYAPQLARATTRIFRREAFVL